MKFEFFDGQKKPWSVVNSSLQQVKDVDHNFVQSDFLGVRPNNVLFRKKASIQYTFHQVIKPVILTGQAFGILPIQGVTSKTATSLTFTLRDFRLYYTLGIILASSTMAMITLYWVVRQHIQFDRMEPLIWYSTNTVTFLSFIVVARRWRKIMVSWEKVENQFTIFDLHTYKQMKKAIYYISFAIPFLSLIEHLLSIANGVDNARKCKNVNGLLEGYFKQSFPAYYYSFEYNLLNATCLQLLNMYTTFAWNFMDNFIIVISLGLAAQFRHFNVQINKFGAMALSEDFWAEQRKYYCALCDLLYEVDENIALITMLSFGNNLYYICLQLFNSFKPSGSPIRSVYFWFSLFFLIGRALAVSFSAAQINDESKRPVDVIRLVPTKFYLCEARRFLEHVTNATIALSGMRFFFITRKFILQVAGTVVTYELVLVQLQKEQLNEVDPCNR